jgi:hypothetical protein
MTKRCSQDLTDGKMKSYLPINIEMEKIKKNYNNSINLSKFEYDFKEVNKINMYKLKVNNTPIKGFIPIGISDTVTAKFSTMGNITLVFMIMFIKSANLYDGEEMDGELLLIFKSIKTDKLLCVIIPIKRTTGKSKQTNWFSQFGDIDFSSDKDVEEIEVNNFTLNDIIPESEFIYYPNSMFAPFGCDHADAMKADYIIFPKESAINIKANTYRKLRDTFGGDFKHNLSDTIDSPFFKKISWCKSSSNHKECMKVNEKGIYLNPRGTKAGPGFNMEPDVSAMTCEPIVDEDDNPIDGRLRLSWLKTVSFGVPESVRNSFMLVILSVVLLGIVVVVHDTVFNKLGLLIGTEKILDRHTIK